MTTITTTPAERLAAAADRHGLWAKDAARFEDIRAEFDLTEADCTPDVIDEAHSIGRARLAKLQARIAAYNERVQQQRGTATVQATIDGVTVDAKVYQPKPTTRAKAGPRAKIFGYSVTAVLRWMGTQDWKFEDAAIAVETLGGKRVADCTVKIQLNAGRNGHRGKPAPVTPSQARKLVEASK